MIGSLVKQFFPALGRFIGYHTGQLFHPQRTIPAAAVSKVSGENETEVGAGNMSNEIGSGDPVKGLRLDLGCGTNKREGFIGIDRRKFEGVDGTADLTKKDWLFEQSELGGVKLLPASADGSTNFRLPDNSVGEVFCSHFLEHLEHNQRHPERVRFMNELWRVLVPGGKATIITPHWASNRAFGDFTHADKPVSEMFYFYLNKDWRKVNAPDNDVEFNPDGYSCNFEAQWGHSMHPDIKKLSQHNMEYAIKWYKDAAEDLIAVLTASK